MVYLLTTLEILNSKMNNNIIVHQYKLVLIKNHKTIKKNLQNKIQNQYNRLRNKNMIQINLKTKISWKKMNKINNL